MRNLLKLSFFLLITFLAASCSTPECIRCNQVQGYPDAVICRDTYETAMEENTPTWKEYAGDALTAGCTKGD